MDFILNTLLQRPSVVADHLHDNVTQPPAVDATVGYGLVQQPVARSTVWLIGVPAVLGLWVILCSSLRFRNEKAMLRRYNYSTRASLAKMTNDDAQQILKYILDSEFPFTYKLSLQFALFKTYAFSTISSLLAHTKSFSDPTMAPKRYEDTTVIFGEFSVNPPTSERAIQAIARMNDLHRPYKKAGKISNADLLYTLSVAVTEPIKWIGLYEWRPLNDLEVCAIGTFWKSIGDAMEIEYKGYLTQDNWKDGIEFVDDITAWAKSYELRDMKPHASNRILADALVGMLLPFIPAADFALQIMAVLMNDRVREAFMYPEPGISACLVTYAALNLHRFFLRYFCLPRLRPIIFFSEEADPHTGRVTHFDYLLEPFYHPPTFWSRWGPIALVFRLVGGTVPGASEFLPEGFIPTDLGPKNRMGKGAEEMEIDMARMRKTRPSGSPFSAHLD
ncbi:hypothetical protein LA080_015923 [Diaporthe eres]|uniref:ER-bound oxygenase mpaB/mpaB'/Rubber oxygenase catalytic domain-containing protein n=1 Tax=Diaporthe vaccinii TaxID=105482 RepID=A0ABR4F954_9PEZI|nr:hypothetical protein LA080_015923 [Diaporthe eres]